MRHLLYISFLILCFSNVVVAQSTSDRITQILNLYDSIPQLKEKHKQAYFTQLYADEWFQLLKDSGFTYPDSANHLLRKTESPDHLITLYYFVHPSQISGYKTDLFAVYNRDSVRRVVRFTETLPDLHQNKPIEPTNIEFQFTNIQKDCINHYELKYFNKLQPEISNNYIDFYLKCLFEEMAETRIDSEKDAINALILDRMRLLWNDPLYFKNSFDGYNRMSTILSDDEKVKICTWNIEQSDATHRFFGAIITNINNHLVVSELTDKTMDMKNADRQILSPKKWYGAIYLDVIHTSYKKIDYYTLIGFKGNSELTKIKLVEVMTIQSNGEPRFGSSIMTKGPGYAPRLIFEYSAGTNMMMKYDKLHKMIVMDNLSPSEPMFKDVYRFYGPDFSYNGYKFEKGKWVLYPDIDIRNPKTDTPSTKPVRNPKIPVTIAK